MDSAQPAAPLDPELAAVYTSATTAEDVAHKLCLMLVLRAWRLISIAHGDSTPLDKEHPFGDSHLHKSMHRLQEESIADSTYLFMAAVSGLRNVCVDYSKMYEQHGGMLPINCLADGTALQEGCAGRFAENWHQVAVLIARELLQIVDAAVPRGKFLAPEKVLRFSSNTMVPVAEMLADLPETAQPHIVVITSEMRTKVYDAIKRARFTVFNIEQLQARMSAECRWASSFQALLKATQSAPAAAPSAESIPAAKQNRGKKRRADAATEARDKWIYDQCCKGVAYETIAIRLKRKPAKWLRIESKQGIQSAAQRYARRHGLEEIPRRQDAE